MAVPLRNRVIASFSATLNHDAFKSNNSIPWTNTPKQPLPIVGRGCARYWWRG